MADSPSPAPNPNTAPPRQPARRACGGADDGAGRHVGPGAVALPVHVALVDGGPAPYDGADGRTGKDRRDHDLAGGVHVVHRVAAVAVRVGELSRGIGAGPQREERVEVARAEVVLAVLPVELLALPAPAVVGAVRRQLHGRAVGVVVVGALEAGRGGVAAHVALGVLHREVYRAAGVAVAPGHEVHAHQPEFPVGPVDPVRTVDTDSRDGDLGEAPVLSGPAVGIPDPVAVLVVGDVNGRFRAGDFTNSCPHYIQCNILRNGRKPG